MPFADLRSRLGASVLGRHLLLAGLALAVVVLVVETSSPYRNTQWIQLAHLAIAAGGLTVLTGLSGQLSLGHGALMAVGAYTVAVLLEDGATSLLVVLGAAALSALVVGAVVGVAAARLHGPYIAGATLALAIAVPGVALSVDRLGGSTGMVVTMPEIPTWVADAAWFVTGRELDRGRYLAYVSWLALILTYVALANLMRSRVGRRWCAVRDDDVAAELAGINLATSRVLAFTVSATCAGLAGGLLALGVRLAAPGSFSLTLSLTLLSAVVLGGLGSLSGAVIGSALLTFLPPFATDFGVQQGLSDVRAAELAPLLYGLTMVVVVILAPAGITGTLRQTWRRFRPTRRPGPDQPSPAQPEEPGTTRGERHDPETQTPGPHLRHLRSGPGPRRVRRRRGTDR